jgi:hypothetical protein
MGLADATEVAGLLRSGTVRLAAFSMHLVKPGLIAVEPRHSHSARFRHVLHHALHIDHPV